MVESARNLATGDLIQINFDDLAAHESIYAREKLDVPYEDDDIAVVIKPAGTSIVSFGYMLPFSLQLTDFVDDTQEQPHPADIPEAATEQDEHRHDENDEDDEDEDFIEQSNISSIPDKQGRGRCAAIHSLERASSGLVRPMKHCLSTSKQHAACAYY